MQAVLEYKSVYKDFPYAVLFMPGCYRCGYVGIPTGNSFYENSVGDLGFIECHGGITYAEYRLLGIESSNIWWIGFDCAHAYDGYDIETAESYFGDDPDWKKTVGSQTMQEYYKRVNGEYEFQSMGYVKSECQKIIDQIIEITGNN